MSETTSPSMQARAGQTRTARKRLAIVDAATTLFLIPILCFTVLLRKHLLRGITFGAIRK